MTANTDYNLDITAEVCPMTFVRTKLLVERMTPGQVVEIRLKGKEPLANVPRSLAELGHEILGCCAEAGEGAEGIHRLVVRKK
ncbi:MAG TPA: sulfurtransferase TusA family protein [Candidatus Omnitrophota bacterium]|nr:sulfurtransferase TusA family protein [Candidatus Omnitrophota bacterium]